MSSTISLRRPGAEVGDRQDLRADFQVDPFDLYGRHHEVESAEANVGVTRLAEGLHLDLLVRMEVKTTCDRTLEPVDLSLEFGDSEFLPEPDDDELCVEDWVLDLACYVEKALPNEVPMQVFGPGTRPVEPERDPDEVDPRWRGLGDLFAS